MSVHRIWLLATILVTSCRSTGAIDPYGLPVGGPASHTDSTTTSFESLYNSVRAACAELVVDPGEIVRRRLSRLPAIQMELVHRQPTEEKCADVLLTENADMYAHVYSYSPSGNLRDWYEPDDRRAARLMLQQLDSELREYTVLVAQFEEQFRSRYHGVSMWPFVGSPPPDNLAWSDSLVWRDILSSLGTSRTRRMFPSWEVLGSKGRQPHTVRSTPRPRRQHTSRRVAATGSPLPPQELSPDQAIDREYRRLGRGRVVFTPIPPRSRVGRRDTLRLWITKDPKRPLPQIMIQSSTRSYQTQTLVPSAPELLDTLQLQIRNVRVSTSMSANLTGSGFRIHQLFPTTKDEPQIIGSDDDTPWEWEFEPKSSGPQELLLSVKAYVRAGDLRDMREYEVLRERIQIAVDPMATIRIWWEDQPALVQNGLALVTVIMTAIGGLYAFARRNRTANAATEV